jgi:hypothetical protein
MIVNYYYYLSFQVLKKKETNYITAYLRTVIVVIAVVVAIAISIASM